MDSRIKGAAVALLLGLAIVFLWFQFGEDEVDAVNDAGSAPIKASSRPPTLDAVSPKPKALVVSEPTPSTVGDPSDEREEMKADEVVAPVTASDSPPIRMGSLSRNEIDEGIREVLMDIRGCYQETLEVVPDLAGMIKVRFTIKAIDGAGRVVNASIDDADFDDVPMEECILDVMETVEFASPQGGGIVMVTYPFNFTT